LCRAGYFRVNYDARNWEMIHQQLMTDHTAISVINRAQIMDDALNLAQAGLLDYDIALNLTSYLAREDQYLPWESTLSSLLYVQDMLSRSSAYGLFKVRLLSSI
jgi:aminopeptidase N